MLAWVPTILRWLDIEAKCKFRQTLTERDVAIAHQRAELQSRFNLRDAPVDLFDWLVVDARNSPAHESFRVEVPQFDPV